MKTKTIKKSTRTQKSGRPVGSKKSARNKDPKRELTKRHLPRSIMVSPEEWKRIEWYHCPLSPEEQLEELRQMARKRAKTKTPYWCHEVGLDSCLSANPACFLLETRWKPIYVHCKRYLCLFYEEPMSVVRVDYLQIVRSGLNWNSQRCFCGADWCCRALIRF